MNPMNIKIRLLTLAVAAALCASTALASEIYRYIDADGNVRYADIPTGNPSEEHLNISSRPTDDDAVRASVASQQEAWNANAQRRAEQEDAEKLSRGEPSAVVAARQKTCKENRDRLISYIQSRRLYREGEDGERIFIGEIETQQAYDQVEALIDENCD